MIMLCNFCQDIFSIPRALSFGTYYPWGHTLESFEAARLAGCHLCNLVWENISYNSTGSGYKGAFTENCTYAFKVLNADWARRGKGSMWLSQVTWDGDEEFDSKTYVAAMGNDPGDSIKYFASILKTGSEAQIAELGKFWLVLDFYCPGPRIVLPLEVLQTNGVEDLAHVNLEQQASTGSKENLQLASSWLSDCINNHPQCRPAFDDENWAPSRLIYVGSLDDPELRIVATSSLTDKVPYAALSHRWGSTEISILTSDLLSKYQKEIPPSDVSATVRDAAHATRSIELQYLWVDSLCIVRDDPEDWSQESASMAKVYGLSTCTFAAALGGNGDDGCFTNRNQYLVRPCKIPNPFSKDSNLSFCLRSQYLNKIYEREVKGSLWYNRGWVFQERTLPPRLLIFGKTQMLWACQKLQAAETWPCGKTITDFIDRFESFEVEKLRLQSLSDKDRAVSSWDTTWWTFILDYTRSEITRKSDRLIALQGLASKIERATGRQYCAGLWIDASLPLSLLWKSASKAPVSNRPRPKEYRAPTWSWASIDGPIAFDTKKNYYSRKIMIDVLRTTALPNERHHTSAVPLAALRISGCLIDAVLAMSSTGDPVELRRPPETAESEILDQPGGESMIPGVNEAGDVLERPRKGDEEQQSQPAAKPNIFSRTRKHALHYISALQSRLSQALSALSDLAKRALQSLLAFCHRHTLPLYILTALKYLWAITLLPFVLPFLLLYWCCSGLTHTVKRWLRASLSPEQLQELEMFETLSVRLAREGKGRERSLGGECALDAAIPFESAVAIAVAHGKAEAESVECERTEVVEAEAAPHCATEERELEVVCLPVLARNEEYHGLVLRAVPGQVHDDGSLCNHYERLGTFSFGAWRTPEVEAGSYGRQTIILM